MATPDKKALRRACRARRAAIVADDARRWSAQACAYAVDLIERRGVHGPVAGYWPIGSELDCRPALAALAERGHVIALPAVEAAHQPLVFRRWREGDALSAGAHGTSQPLPSQAACVPKVLLVPLLGFDEAGHRLGYGGGYYDRSIQALRAGGPLVVIGLGFAAQRLPTAMPQDHDARLDWIVTEAGAQGWD